MIARRFCVILRFFFREYPSRQRRSSGHCSYKGMLRHQSHPSQGGPCPRQWSHNYCRSVRRRAGPQWPLLVFFLAGITGESIAAVNRSASEPDQNENTQDPNASICFCVYRGLSFHSKHSTSVFGSRGTCRRLNHPLRLWCIKCSSRSSPIAGLTKEQKRQSDNYGSESNAPRMETPFEPEKYK